MRLLVVEDDRYYAQVISELLMDREMDVTLVHTAEAAVAEDAHVYEGAVIDLMLPERSRIVWNHLRRK